MRFYVRYQDTDGAFKSCIYHSFSKYFADTFSPAIKVVAWLRLGVKGKTYQDRRENLRDIAVDWSYMQADAVLSWREYAEITDFFEKNGRRYGLLREFRENCVC